MIEILLFLIPKFSSFALLFFLVSLMHLQGSALGSMAVEYTPKGMESVLGGDNLVKIQECFILMSIGLKLPGPFERMIMGSVMRGIA